VRGREVKHVRKRKEGGRAGRREGCTLRGRVVGEGNGAKDEDSSQMEQVEKEGGREGGREGEGAGS